MIEQELDPAFRISSNPVRKMTYNDRYIRTPLHVALLAQIIHYAKNSGGLKHVEVNTTELDEPFSKRPHKLFHNWQRSKELEFVLRRVFMELNVQPRVRLTKRFDLTHSRSMRIEFESGKLLSIHLDQGMGYWRAVGQAVFDFDCDRDAQARNILGSNTNISGDRQHATFFVIGKNNNQRS